MFVRTFLSVRLMAGSIIVSLALPSIANAEDWAQWRGPNRDGKSAETGLLQEWPDSGPKLIWQVNSCSS